MRKYVYDDRKYDSLFQLRQAAPHLIFSDDAPADLLEQIGIAVMEIPDPEPDPEEQARLELELKLAAIDQETSAAIMAGFDYAIDGQTYHFSYDSFDQQNFADTANACLMSKSGMPGLPDMVTWNGYTEDGSLTRLELDADGFLALYAAGALAHKAACMEEGGRKKAALLAESKEPANVE